MFDVLAEAVPNSWEDLDSSSTEGYPSDEEETVEEVSVEVQETHTEIEHSDTQEITPKSLPEDRNIEEVKVLYICKVFEDKVI